LPNESMRAKLDLSRHLPNLAGLFLAASGSIILASVGWLTWYDMTTYGKDIALTFFGSRTGEAISLGIDMKVIHYFLISLALLLSGLLTLLRRHLPKNVPIPQDLIGKLARARAKLLAGLAFMTILGVSLYLSPIRGNTVAVVGIFASLSALIIAFLATTEIEITTVEEEYRDKTSMEENYAYKTMSNTAGPLDFSHMNMNLRKTSEFQMDIYSSENQITLSSHYAPRRAHFVELPRKKRQVKR